MSKKKIGIILACVLAVLIPVIVLTVDSPLPTMTEEEQSYISFLQDNANKVGDALEEFIALSDEFEIGTDEWEFAMTAQLTTIFLAYDEAVQINPPASMIHIHLKYIQAMNNFNDVAHLMASSIKNNTLLDDNETKAKFELGLQHFEEWADLLVAFKAAHKAI